MTIYHLGDFPEDRHLENGNYENVCVHCGCSFIGHKRRVRCKQCEASIGPFQQQVLPWMMACFGPVISSDRVERNHRFLEESLELVQACDCSAEEAHELVDYVFDRPVGEKAQEVGGVMVTLAALCLAQELDMHEAGDVELARIWKNVEKIRAKQAAKPKFSPLPEHPVKPSAPQVPQDVRRAAKALIDRYHTYGGVVDAVLFNNLEVALARVPAERLSGWRCFHCNETFADETQAALHFGTHERHSPACQIDIAEYRAMEKRMEAYNEEDAEIHRAMHCMKNDHAQALRREEEKGYARALKDTGYVDQPSAPSLTPHLRQFMHNDGSGLVFGYDKEGIDREVALLASRVPAEQPSAPSLSDMAGFNQPYRGEPVYGPASFVKTSEQPAPPSALILAKEIDLSKAVQHEHPDIHLDRLYLCQHDDSWHVGHFNRLWYGMNFGGWRFGSAGLQFDAPGQNMSRWQRVIEIEIAPR